MTFKRAFLGATPALRRTTRALAPFLASAWLFTCGDSSDRDEQVLQLSAKCALSSQCEDPYVCVFERCHEECSTDRDCNRGSRCVVSDVDSDARVCQLEEEVSCEADNDCPGGQTCASNARCHDGCENNDDCANDQTCTAGVCASEEEIDAEGELLPPEDEPEQPADAGQSSTLDDATGDDTADGGNTEDDEATGNEADGGETEDPGGTIEMGPSELSDCGDRDASNATEITGSINENQVWSGTMYLTGDVYIYETLTIEPGTQIIAGPDAVFWVNGTLEAIGTEDAPIRFCGERSQPGFWQGVQFYAAATNSTLQHVLISDAGSAGVALDLAATDVFVDNVLVQGSESIAVRAAGFTSGGSNLSVEGTVGVAVELTAPKAVDAFPTGGTFTDNEDNSIRLSFTTIAEPVVFQDHGIPYVQDADVYTYAESELEFQAGADYRFEADKTLTLNGAVVIDGTEADPVIFSGAEEFPGYWKTITVSSAVTAQSRFSNVVFRHGGQEDVPVLNIQRAITFENLIFEDNGGSVTIGAVGVSEDSANWSFANCDCKPLHVTLDSLFALPEGLQFTGNTSDEITIAGGYTATGVTGTIRNHGVPYVVEASIFQYTQNDWTIEPGVEIRFPLDAAFTFQYASRIVAVGTEEAPIRFVGNEDSAGYWQGLVITDVSAQSRFEHIVVANGGGGNPMPNACVALSEAIDLTQSTISDCLGSGIVKAAADMTDYAASNTFENIEGEPVIDR